jgi:hypothetical protein
MFDNNPFTGFINAWRDASAGVLGWVSDRLADLAGFVGLPSAPATELIQEPFTLPFTGGQCVGRSYRVICERNRISTNQGISLFTINTNGAILGTEFRSINGALFWYLLTTSGGQGIVNVTQASANNDLYRIVSVTPNNGLPDDCGNLPNPNPPFPPEYGLVDAENGDDGTGGALVYAGLPIPTVAGILAALKTIADTIRVVADALDGVRKIGDAIKKIADLLDQLFGDKKDRDREKPKYRRYAVGGWYRCVAVDGFIALTPITLGGVQAIPYKIQFLANSFPASASRVLGVNSPSISIDSLPFFYLLLQENDYGVTSVKPIRTLNSSTYIPPFHRGVFWNFRLNPSINAKFRLFYQTEQIEAEVVAS